MKLKRVLLTVLALTLMLCALFVTASAVEIVDSGNCGAQGSNVTWTLDSDGVLTISGKGEIAGYRTVKMFYEGGENPWNSVFTDLVVKKIVIEDGITRIGDSAFSYCSYVTEVVLPDTLTAIGADAFGECEKLLTIDIPASVQEIGGGVFAGCRALQTVVIPEGIKSLDSFTYTETHENYTDGFFTDCPSLTSVTLPKSLTKIDDLAFAWCTSLKKINIPSGVREIGGAAFLGCSSLQTIKLPAGLTRIKYWSKTYGEFDNQVLRGAFEGCSNLTSISIPDSVMTIDPLSFLACSSLKAVNLPGNLEILGPGAFAKCTSLESIVIPDGVQYLDALEDIYMGEDGVDDVLVRILGMFQDCSNLKEVHLPASLKEIGSYTFANCKSLKEVTIPSSVKKLHARAFYDFTGLEKVIIPASVTEIGQCAFWNCFKLQQVVFKGELPKITKGYYWEDVGASLFKNAQISAYYPQSASSWAKANLKAMGDDVTWASFTPVTVKTQPKTTYTKYGETAAVTVKAEGDGLTYQWYYRNAGESTYSKSSNQKDTYKPTMTEASKDRRVYCVITDMYGNQVQTKTVIVRMAASVTTQPKSVVVAKGKTAKVSLKAVGDGLKYEWYYKDKGATSFKKTSTFTGNTYTAEMTAARHGRQVYCKVTDKYGKTVKTNTVTLSMKATVTTQPKSVVVAKGATAKVTVKAVGNGLKYEWYYKDKGATSFKKTTSFTGTNYSVEMTAARHGRQVYCKITDKYGNTVKTNTVTLSMKATVTTQPKSVTVAKGATAKVSFKAVGNGLTYTWYYKDKGATSFKKTTAFTGNTYKVEMTKARSGRQVYCKVTDKYGNTVKTNTVTLKMK